MLVDRQFRDVLSILLHRNFVLVGMTNTLLQGGGGKRERH